ncbi:MAG: hypothetical protein ACK2T3_16525, partial [Candidatus Promineifilaceae bacterium]
ATFEEGSVSQEVTIPSTATDLAFYLEQPACDSAADYMDVRIDGNIVFNTNGISNLCGNVGYTLQTVDISSYADDTSHTLLFESQVIADNEGVTNFFVDDVSISDNLASDPEPSVCRPLTYDLVCNGDVVDFEGGIPPTWSTENTGNVYWTDTEDTDGCDQPNITPGSGIAACADADHTNGAGDPYEAIMTTNVFNLAEYESAALEFATAYVNLTSEDSFEVQVWDGTEWVTELSWNDDHYDPGEIVSLDLSDYDGFTMARFVYSGPGWDWFVQVDDVSLVCGNPIIDAVPSSFDVEMQANEQYTDTLSIGNVGAADLVWTVLEEAAAPRSQLPERAPVADLATSNSGASSGGLRGVSPDGLLWDQTDNPSDNGAPSQYFLDYDGFGISADDFMVPEPGWAITRVVALGSYRDVNSAPDWDVDIYLDIGDSPGPLVFSDAGVAAFTDVDGDVIIDLTTPAELPAGRYWISVVANLAFNGADQWFWTARTVQNGEPYHWTENGLFGTPCNGVWAPGASVCGVGGGVDPDLLFALYGVEEVVESCIPSDIPWVSVSPTDGTTAAGESDDVVVTFDSTGLEVGTYYGDLCVQSNDPETPLVGIPLTLTIPQEPTGVSVSVFGDGSSFSMTPVWLAALVSVSLLVT